MLNFHLGRSSLSHHTSALGASSDHVTLRAERHVPVLSTPGAGRERGSGCLSSEMHFLSRLSQS